MKNLKISIGNIEEIESRDDVAAYFWDSARRENEVRICARNTERFDSVYFKHITDDLKIIMDNIRADSDCIKVNIICPNAQVRDYYMMVYNYWYATEKSERIMSDSWD